MLFGSLIISGCTLDRSLVVQVFQGRNGTLVVRACSLVVECHGTIALEVGNRGNGRIDRKLVVIHTKPVTVGVRVGEQSRLKDGVSRGLVVGNQMAGRESSLLIVV